MADKKLPLKEISIEELFSGSERTVFEIPIYQRNYAWENDEISALVQDIYDAYQQMKARMKQLEKENEKLHDDNKILARRSAQEPIIMEKPVEIVPEDYREVKSKAKAYDAETKRLNSKLEEAYRERNELEDKIRELQEQTAREQTNNDTVASAIYFIAQCGSFIRDVGGYVWLADKIAELPEREREGYIKAIMAVRDWSMVLIDNIERSEYGKSEVERIGSKSGKE